MFSPRLGRVRIQPRAGAADAVQRARCPGRPSCACCTARTSASVSRSCVPGGSFAVISKRSCASCGIRSVPSVGTMRDARPRRPAAAHAQHQPRALAARSAAAAMVAAFGAGRRASSRMSLSLAHHRGRPRAHDAAATRAPPPSATPKHAPAARPLPTPRPAAGERLLPALLSAATADAPALRARTPAARFALSELSIGISVSDTTSEISDARSTRSAPGRGTAGRRCPARTPAGGTPRRWSASTRPPPCSLRGCRRSPPARMPSPRSRALAMLSSTTIESSTTRPVASARPASDITLRLRPSWSMKKKVAMIDTGSDSADHERAPAVAQEEEDDQDRQQAADHRVDLLARR